MPLQNFEQIRAKSALAFAKSPAEKRGKDGGDAIRKIPAMIMGSGLLATLAFSIEEKFDKKLQKSKYAREGYAAIFDAIADHLSSKHIAITATSKTAKALIDELAASSSETLKLATAESLAWLSYARRFVSGAAAAADEVEEEDEL
jgi:CRISPR type III-B/RAMP module-associated protein Cmr5